MSVKNPPLLTTHYFKNVGHTICPKLHLHIPWYGRTAAYVWHGMVKYGMVWKKLVALLSSTIYDFFTNLVNYCILQRLMAYMLLNTMCMNCVERALILTTLFICQSKRLHWNEFRSLHQLLTATHMCLNPTYEVVRTKQIKKREIQVKLVSNSEKICFIIMCEVFDPCILILLINTDQQILHLILLSHCHLDL